MWDSESETVFALTIISLLQLVRQGHRLRPFKRKEGTVNDHVSFTVTVVLLTHLLVDGPHITVHPMPNQPLASIITHMIFYLHLVLDPLILVGLNVHYRRKLLWRLKVLLPHAWTTDLTPPPPSSTENVESRERRGQHSSIHESAGIDSPNITSF